MDGDGTCDNGNRQTMGTNGVETGTETVEWLGMGTSDCPVQPSIPEYYICSPNTLDTHCEQGDHVNSPMIPDGFMARVQLD